METEKQKQLRDKKLLLDEAINNLPITEKELTDYINNLNKLVKRLEVIFMDNGLCEDVSNMMYAITIEVNSKLNLRFKASNGKDYINRLKNEIKELENII